MNLKCSAVVLAPQQHKSWFSSPHTPLTSGALSAQAALEQSLPASRRQQHKLQTKPDWTHTSALTGKHFPQPITNQSIPHKDKTTSILLHNKAEKETWQKSHLSLSFAFKSCFAVWWKVPNCITVIQHCQGCINSWNAKSHSHQHQLCRL